MPGESPLSMMRPPGQRVRKHSAVPARRRRLWPVLASAAIVIVLAPAWVWLWYYAASVADRTLAGWVEREAAAGRVYSCAAQSIGGFPFRIEARCADAAAEINSNQPPYAVRAKDVVMAAQVYDPTLLIGDITGPLTWAESGQPPSFVAEWSRARVSVRGVPPYPESAAVMLDRARLDRAGGAGGASGNGAMLFAADHADLHGRIIAGSPSDHPVIEAVLQLKAAAAPTLHPLTAEPIDGDIDVVLRGFKDLRSKPWTDHFREMQAAGGGIEIKFLRVARSDAIVVGTGTLSVNANGKLDGSDPPRHRRHRPYRPASWASTG